MQLSLWKAIGNPTWIPLRRKRLALLLARVLGLSTRKSSTTLARCALSAQDDAQRGWACEQSEVTMLFMFAPYIPLCVILSEVEISPSD